MTDTPLLKLTRPWLRRQRSPAPLGSFDEQVIKDIAAELRLAPPQDDCPSGPLRRGNFYNSPGMIALARTAALAE